MIRVVVFLVFVGLCALGVAWLADRPGEVRIVWQNHQIDTSLMVLIAATAVVAVLTVIAWSLVRFVWRSPRRLAEAIERRRRNKGYEAISRGLIAIGSGDPAAARKFASDAAKVAPAEPLALLLQAQSAQLTGDRNAARAAFQAMARRPDTKLLGLHGLFIEAQRGNDPQSARLFAEAAARTAPALPWAAEAALDFRCAAGDWEGALAIVEANYKNGLFDKATFRRQRAVLLTARALAAEDTDRAAALSFATEAVKLAPDLVPAAALAGRLLGEDADLRKAARVIESAWGANPHPDLADAYTHLRFGDSARDRLARAQKLASHHPGHLESALAVAHAAMDAHEFGLARSALDPFLKSPTRRVAMLMADIEETEHGDEGRAREWTARAVHAAQDPAWTADGFISEQWLPVSPVTGRLDAFQWKVPLAELADHATLDEREPERPVIDVRPDEPKVVTQVPPLEPDTAPVGGPTMKSGPDLGGPDRPLKRVPEAVIPLVHAPDDPGPVHDVDVDAGSAAKPSGDIWHKFRQFFR